MGACQVPSLQVEIRNARLKNSLVELPDPTRLLAPGDLQLFVSRKVVALIEQQDALACPRVHGATAIVHVRGSITCGLPGPGGRISARMNTRMWVLAACLIVLATIVLLAPSLGAVRFEPARPFAFGASPEGRLVFPALSMPEDTPLWKILALWLAIVVNLALVLLMLSPELRKRVLRQLIRFALGILLFLLLLRYRVLQWPQTELDPAAAGSAGPSVPAPPLEVQAFQPPQVATWVTYAVTLLVLWLALLGVFLVYQAWQRQRSRRLTTVSDIASIAKASLADLAEGRHWNDVVIEVYAQMNEAVWRDRGLHRESSATPREFAARLSRTGLPASSLDELTRLFETVRYGANDSDASAGQRAAACLESILRACRATA